MPTGCTKAIINSEALKQSSTDIVRQVIGSFEPPKAIPDKSDIDVGHVNSITDVLQIFNPLSREEKENPKTSAIVPSENTDKQAPHRDFHNSCINQVRQDTKLFSETYLQVILNLGLQPELEYRFTNTNHG